MARRGRLLERVLGRGACSAAWSEGVGLCVTQLVVEVVMHLHLVLLGDALVRDQVGLMELLLGNRLAEATQALNGGRGGAWTRCGIISSLEITDRLLSQVIDYVIFFGGFILMLWRHAH